MLDEDQTQQGILLSGVCGKRRVCRLRRRFNQRDGSERHSVGGMACRERARVRAIISTALRLYAVRKLRASLEHCCIDCAGAGLGVYYALYTTTVGERIVLPLV